ncbi:MAG: hypothetical protein DWQ34_01115 [Planctomycetota bacterium]|nr:MAG: hypothetical protein DWQ29_19525 [Planctomycetota bacterium]REJ97794.1 MAG: hypothetical protein DWQ34_01115 [Planctomycetota bacterium]REK22002.1 MAG: hypothetical protein DWQ41_20015 [Planctomycetota bacterium]REK31250.1 MAG: hypothetical protein DWQ45_19745 [Planctomycetota bacterium]
MHRCSHCDHFNPEDATQCERCGAPLDVAAARQLDDTASPEGGPVDPFVREILATAATRGKIAAIKQYREATGSGLKDAKEAVEAMMREHRIVANTGGAGCAGVVAAVVVLSVLTWEILFFCKDLPAMRV